MQRSPEALNPGEPTSCVRTREPMIRDRRTRTPHRTASTPFVPGRCSGASQACPRSPVCLLPRSIGSSIYRKFKNSFPGALRPESGMVGRGTVTGAAIPALWCLRGRYAQGCGRSHPAGGVKSLEAEGFGDRRKRSRARGSKSVQIGDGGRSARGEFRRHRRLGTRENRWHATRPAHPLAIAVHERIDAKAFLHRRSPTKSSGLS